MKIVEWRVGMRKVEKEGGSKRRKERMGKPEVGLRV